VTANHGSLCRQGFQKMGVAMVEDMEDIPTMAVVFYDERVLD
jgi:hypothetical protein